MRGFQSNTIIFQLFLLLTPIYSFLQDNSVSKYNETEEEIISEIDSYLKNVKNMIQEHYNRDAKSHGRTKRSTSLSSIISQHPEGVFRFNSFSELYLLPARFPNDIVLFCLPREKSACFAITIEGKKQNEVFSSTMVLYKFQENSFIKKDCANVKNATRLATHFINEYQYVVVTNYFNNGYTSVNSIDDGSQVYRINPTSNKFELVQTLMHKQLSDIFIWEHENMNAVFLGAATNITENLKHNTESHIYKWVGTNFDIIDTIKTFSPKCITSFTIGNKMYLAVANFKNDRGETDIDSEIFRFDLHREKFYLHQKLRTHAAMDIKFFSFDSKENFLVVANHFEKASDDSVNYDTYSIIYKYSEDDYFIPFQSIKVSGAIQWLPILDGSDKFLLLVASKFYGVKAYQYDGWLFVETSVQYSRDTFGPGISTMRQFQFNNHSVVTIANNKNDGTMNNMFEVLYDRDDGLPKFYTESQKWCSETLKEVKDNYRYINELANSIEGVPHVNDTIIKTNSSLVLNMANISVAEVVMPVIDSSEKVENENFTSVKNFINDINIELDRLSKASEGIPSDTFQNDEHFTNIEFDCDPLPCQFSEIYIETLNGEDLTKFLENSLNLESNLTASSDCVQLEFEYAAVQNPVVVHYINNHKVEDLLTEKSLVELNQKVVVHGNVHINNNDGVTVLGKVDNVRITNDSVIMVNGNQDFQGSKSFNVDSLIIKNLTIENSLNGLQIGNRFINKRDSMINYFRQLNVDKLDLLDGLINGIDVLDLVNNAMKVNAQEQTVTGFHVYDSLKVNELVVNGNLYDVSEIPEISQLNDYSVIDNILPNRELKYFQAISKNSDNKSSDDIERSSDGSGEDISKDGQNGSRSYKISESFPDDLPGKGDLFKKQMVHEDDVTYHGNVNIEGRLIVSHGTLKVTDLIILNEHFNLSHLIENALRLDDNIDQEFVFETPFKSESLQAKEVNGIKPESWFHKGKDDVITGDKLFDGDIHFRGGVIINNTINGINVQNLGNNSDELQTENITGKSDTTKDKLRGDSLILEDFEIDHDIVIEGTVIVQNNVNVQSLQVDDDNLVNGIYIDELMDYVMNKTVSGDFNTPKVFNNNLTIENLYCNNIEGFNEKNIQGVNYCETVEINEDSEIEYFRNKYITADSLQYFGFLDGVSSGEFGKWLLSDGIQEILGQQTMNSVYTKEGLKIVSNTVNGVNINEISENGIRIDETANLTGIVFEHIVETDYSNLEDRLINGFDITKDIILNNSKSSPISISGDVILRNDLEVDHIYNLDLENLCRFFMEDSSDDKLLLVDGSVKFSEEPFITNQMNNVTLEHLREFVWFTYDDRVINSSVFFEDVVFHNSIDLMGNFNNKKIEDLDKQYLSLSKDQTISSPVVFNGGITVKGQLHCKKVTVGRYVDGIMIEKFVDNVLLDGVDQNFTDILEFLNISIQGDFKTSGLINDLDIESDFLVLDSNHNDTIIVSGYTIINDVKTNELLLEPSTKIQNVDIENWFKTAVRETGNYIINGHKIFKNGISVAKNIEVEGLVNGIKFDNENVLLLFHNQTLSGNNQFNETDLTINQLYTDRNINGINISDLLRRLTFKDKDNEITGNKVFLSELHGDNVMLPDYYGELNLTKLNDNLMNYDKHQAYSYKEELRILSDVKKNVELSILGQAFLLKGWKKIHRLRRDNILMVIPLETHDPDKIAIGVITAYFNKYFLSIYEWNDNLQFVLKLDSKKSMKFLPHIISTVPTHETDIGLKANKFFIITFAKDVIEPEILKKARKDNITIPMYRGWLFHWNMTTKKDQNISSENVSDPYFHWFANTKYHVLLLHIYDSCYLLLEHEVGSVCRLYCENILVRSFSCNNVVQSLVTTDGYHPYVLIFHEINNVSDDNKTENSARLAIRKFNFENNTLVPVGDFAINNPDSTSTVYDSDKRQHVVGVTSGVKLTIFRFNQDWQLIETLIYEVGAETSIIMRILPTKEIILFLASPCTNLSTQILVGGISSPKNIPISIRGNKIKQVIPMKFKNIQTTEDSKSDLESFIIVTDIETAVFHPIYTL